MRNQEVVFSAKFCGCAGKAAAIPPVHCVAAVLGLGKVESEAWKKCGTPDKRKLNGHPLLVSASPTLTKAALAQVATMALSACK